MSVTEFQHTLESVVKLIKTNDIKHAIELNIKPTDTFAVFGDIHADIKTLTKAYKIAKDKGVKYFIFCGDYIDKGEDSMGSFKFVLDHFVEDHKHFIPLMGNHEMMLCGNLFIDLVKQPEIISLCQEVISLMPFACLIHFNNKNIFCAHGAYPFIYKHKYIHIEDEFDDVWKLIGNVNEPEDVNELVYESNTSFDSLSPVDWINKLYDELAYQSSLIVENIYSINMFSKIVNKLKEIQKAMKSNEQTKIDELITKFKSEEFNKYFIVKLNDYKAYKAKLEKARQAVVYIRDYVGWGDMYISEKNVNDIKTKEEFIAIVEKEGTQFFKANRFEVKRYNLAYSVKQLKQWMSDNKINAFIRGHQLTLKCCNVVDLNTNKETTAPETVELNNDSQLYITLHTTTSYSKYDQEFYGTARFVIVNNKNINVVSVTN